jgi:propionate CoA-transferase
MLEIPMVRAPDLRCRRRTSFFVNFEGLNVRSTDDIARISPGGRRCAGDGRAQGERHRQLRPFVHQFRNWSMTTSRWSRASSSAHYHEVTRYTSSTFLRVKLGEALQKRKLAPHLLRVGGVKRRLRCPLRRGF